MCAQLGLPATDLGLSAKSAAQGRFRFSVGQMLAAAIAGKGIFLKRGGAGDRFRHRLFCL